MIYDNHLLYCIVLYMNLETIRPRGGPRNRWLDEVREDGRMVGGEQWQEKVYGREEWKRLLRTARNHSILFMPMDWLIHSFINTAIWFSLLQCILSNRSWDITVFIIIYIILKSPELNSTLRTSEPHDYRSFYIWMVHHLMSYWRLLPLH